MRIVLFCGSAEEFVRERQTLFGPVDGAPAIATSEVHGPIVVFNDRATGDVREAKRRADGSFCRVQRPVFRGRFADSLAVTSGPRGSMALVFSACAEDACSLYWGRREPVR